MYIAVVVFPGLCESMKLRNVLSMKTLYMNFSYCPKNMTNQRRVTFALVIKSLSS